MRTAVTKVVTGAVVLMLAVGGCTGDGSGDDADDGSGGGGGTGDSSTKQDRKAVPTDTTAPIKAAAKAAGSVVVTRTLKEADGDVTQEEIETAFATPPSARVLHVGAEIWTLDVVEGVGYVKEQTEKKSENRWTRLTERETAERLEGASLDGLLGVLDAATTISKASTATLRSVKVTCHTAALQESQGADASARVCVDSKRLPVELVVTSGKDVTTSVFTGWGSQIMAIAPPEHLVD